MSSTFLIADDAPLMRIMLKDIVEKNHCHVIGQADNAKTTIDKFFTLKPDVLLLDVSLPDLSSLDVLKIIRGLDPTAKVVMVGVEGEEKIWEQCIGKGATGYILKPFSTDKVTAMIKSVL